MYDINDRSRSRVGGNVNGATRGRKPRHDEEDGRGDAMDRSSPGGD
jgi:hypothetical protein